MAVKTKIASDLFRQKWFRELKPELKLLWLYLTVESNIVGVFEIDPESWSFFIGAKVTVEDVFYRFGKRFQRIPGHPEKGIQVGKLDYQAGFGQNSAQWKWVEKELAAVGLTYERLQEMKSHEEEQLELGLDFGEQKTRTPETPSERRAKSRDRGVIVPPQVEWVQEYIAEKGYDVDARNFCDFYTSKGWKVGKAPMQDWRAAVRTWARRNKVEKAQGAIVQDLRRKF